METIGDPAQAFEQLRTVLTSGPVPVLVYPFRLLVRPYLATDLAGFLLAAWPAFLILLAHYWFVVRADVAFEEASLEASRQLAERVAAVRAGKGASGGVAKPRRPPFALAPTGFPPVALLWKNLINAGRVFNTRLLLVLVIMCTVAFFSLSVGTRSSGALALVGIFALMFLVWSLLLGPQVLSQDLRQDLRMADQLKMYPLPGWQLVLGELLAPALILTCIQWLLIPLALGGLMRISKGELEFSVLAGPALALAILAPVLNLLSFVIPNASVLLFPAWFQFQGDKAMSHGIEVMGQRIILLLGQMFALLLATLPAGLVFAVALLALKWVLGWLISALVAAVLAATVIGLEVALALLLMGRWFERLDVSEAAAA
jgi:hypothetical protein